MLINSNAFNTLKKDIANRKLFVLFEEKLNCDTMTDHLNPKNVLPLYSEYISTAQRAISQLDEQFILHKINQAIVEITSDEVTARCEAELKLHEADAKAQRL